MLTQDQRKWRADKIGDLANIAVGSMLFGQFVSSSFHVGFAVLSIVILIAGFYYSDLLLKNIK
jgi:hypothetical protein